MVEKKVISMKDPNRNKYKFTTLVNAKNVIKFFIIIDFTLLYTNRNSSLNKWGKKKVLRYT